MFMITALISILTLHIILALVPVLLVKNRNSASGHAQNRKHRNWLYTTEMA